jgi:hypothetical protein
LPSFSLGCSFAILRSLLGDLPFEKEGQIGSIVRANPQHPAVFQADDHAIPSPQVPDPAAPNAVVDAPAVEEQGPTNLNLVDVGVANCPAEQKDGAETNRQNVALVLDGQVMEGRRKQGDKQAHAAGDENARRVGDHPGESEAGQRRAVQDQAQRGLLRV